MARLARLLSILLIMSSNTVIGGDDVSARTCREAISTLGFGDERSCERNAQYREILGKASTARRLLDHVDEYDRGLSVLLPDESGQNDYKFVHSISELPAHKISNDLQLFDPDGHVLQDGLARKDVVAGTITYIPGARNTPDSGEFINLDGDDGNGAVSLSGHALSGSQRDFLKEFCLPSGFVWALCHGQIYLTAQRRSDPITERIWQSAPDFDLNYEFRLDGAKFQQADHFKLIEVINAARSPPAVENNDRLQLDIIILVAVVSILSFIGFINFARELFRGKPKSKRPEENETQSHDPVQAEDISTSKPSVQIIAAKNSSPVVINPENYPGSNGADIGKLGEEFVFNRERQFLAHKGRSDLAAKVVWASRDLGDGCGYDVQSFFPDGRERFIEVKTTVNRQPVGFTISKNEMSFLTTNPESAFVYRVYLRPDGTEADIEEIRGADLHRNFDVSPCQFRIKVEIP